MRIVAASLKDAYHVFKSLKEYAEDTKQPTPDEADYAHLAEVLSSPKHRYALLMHGKKSIGMIWGSETWRGVFVIEGKFLKRAFRGKMKFTKELFKAKLEITKGYDTVKEKAPFCRNTGKRLYSYKVL